LPDHCGARFAVVPTPVGVNREARKRMGGGRRCPHARGGEPMGYSYDEPSEELSPRPWG